MNEVGRALGALFGTYAGIGVLTAAADADDHSGKSSKERLRTLAKDLKGVKITHKEGPASVEFKGKKDGVVYALLEKDPNYILRAKKNETNAALLHELGHIENDQSWGRPGRAAASLSRGFATGTQPITLAFSAMDPGKSYGPALAQAALASPMVVDEAVASGRAVRKLIEANGFKKGLQEAAPLAPALGTYLLHTAAPAIVTALRRM